MSAEFLDTSEVVAFVLLDLALILVAARTVGTVAERVGQPRVVGEIIAGILLGPTVLGGRLGSRGEQGAVPGEGLVAEIFPLQAFEFLDVLGFVAAILYTFLLGLEVNRGLLTARRVQVVAVAVAVTAIPLALGFAVAGVLDSPGVWMQAVTPEGEAVSFTTHALFIGAALAVSASSVLARLLQEKRLGGSPAGLVASGSSAIVSPLAFLALAAATASAQGAAIETTVGRRIVLGVLVLAALFLVVRPLLARIIPARFDPERPLDSGLFAILLLGVLLSALAADRAGVNALTGALMFGIAVPRVPGLIPAIAERMHTLLVVLFIPVFLVVAGLQTDLGALAPAQLGGLALFVAALIAGKWGVGALTARGTGLTWRESNTVGVLLNCRGIEILIVAEAAQELGVITDTMNSVFVVGALVTLLMTSPLLGVFVPEEEIEDARDRAIASSLAAVPVMTGGPRVVISPHTPALANAAVNAAADYMDRDPPSQFLVAHLPEIPETSSYAGTAMAESAREISRARGWLEPAAARLREAGVDAEVAAFTSPTPHADLAKLADEWAGTEAIVTDPDDADALASAGIEVKRVGA